jgi:uncharacterized coiled-coil protein SlyX
VAACLRVCVARHRGLILIDRSTEELNLICVCCACSGFYGSTIADEKKFQAKIDEMCREISPPNQSLSKLNQAVKTVVAKKAVAPARSPQPTAPTVAPAPELAPEPLAESHPPQLVGTLPAPTALPQTAAAPAPVQYTSAPPVQYTSAPPVQYVAAPTGPPVMQEASQLVQVAMDAARIARLEERESHFHADEIARANAALAKSEHEVARLRGEVTTLCAVASALAALLAAVMTAVAFRAGHRGATNQ